MKHMLITAALAASLACRAETNVTLNVNGLTEEQTVAAEQIVTHIYGEDTNSSFIVRKELTATQKRFLALGFRYVQLVNAYNALDARLRVFEEERAKREANAEKARTRRREREERNRDAVKRAVERTQTGRNLKSQHPAARRSK